MHRVQKNRHVLDIPQTVIWGVRRWHDRKRSKKRYPYVVYAICPSKSKSELCKARLENHTSVATEAMCEMLQNNLAHPKFE